MTKRLPRILIAGDTPNKREVATGFGTVSAALIPHLAQHFDVSVHAVNSLGWDHDFKAEIFPALTWKNQGDPFGIKSISYHVAQVKPAAVVYNNDPWIVNSWVNQVGETLSQVGIPQIAYLAIDSEGIPARHAEPLKRLDRIFVYTDFARRELARHGIESEVLPHGIDTDFWTPGDRLTARNAIGVNPSSFVVLNPNKNQFRKRNDLTVMGYVQWLKQHYERNGVLPDALLHLHCEVHTNEGWNLVEVYQDEMRLAGLSDPHYQRICKTNHLPVSDEGMRDVYRSADVVLNSCSAEGWGLCHAESAACGIPQIVPRHSSFLEVFPEDAPVYWLDDLVRERSREGFLRWTPSVQGLADAIELAYQNHLSRKAIAVGTGMRQAMLRPELQWETIATHLAAAIKITVPKPYLLPPAQEAA